MFKVVYGLFFLGIIFSSCENTENQTYSNGSINHPTQRNMIPNDSINHKLTFEDEALIDTSNLNKISTIGVLEGSRQYMLGNITATKVNSNSEIMILDAQYGIVRVYDVHSGKYKTQFGRAGSGPGEFSQPNDLFIEKGKVYISDRVNKLQAFDAENEFKHKKELAVEFAPNSICGIDNDVFISGVDYEKFLTVHKMNMLNNKKIKSFHEAYKSDRSLARILLSNNIISCNSQTKTLAVVSPNLPYIYGYDMEGNIKWVSELSDYNPIQTIEKTGDSGKPSITKRINPNDITDSYNKLLEIEGTEYFLLQINRSERNNNEVLYSNNMTFLINAFTGEGKFLTLDFPTVEAVSKNILVTKGQKGYPLINIYKGFYEQFQK